MTNIQSLPFLFEIGVEEIPAFDLHKAVLQLEHMVPELFSQQGISCGQTRIYSTPRRLIAEVLDVAAATEEKHEVFKGPNAGIAFDDQGNLTQAGAGFARSKGVEASDIEVREEGGTQYIFATKHTPSIDVVELLPSLAKHIVEGITWPKSQRWGRRSEHFSRPIRWFVCLFGEQVVPFEYAGIVATNTTFGHRFLDAEPIEIASADTFIETLSSKHVVVSEQLREQRIREQIKEIEAESGLVADIPEKIMAEVVNLTEYPTVMKGSFNTLFLDVPSEIIVDAMLVHQRYFPLYDTQGNLTNYFLITSNGNPIYAENIIDGNQRVVDARLYDAKFFYDEDLKQSLESFVEKLTSVVFQEKLGTMYSKTQRLVKLVEYIVQEQSFPKDEKRDATRAAYLAKADLVTSAVVEFTSVQGIMGNYYAAASGENDQVATAISEHYRPRFAGDEIPSGRVGMAVAFADKLDTICGMFAIDQAPTGSSDPFALRRSALGILAMLPQLPISLEGAIDASLGLYADDGLVFDKGEVTQHILEFFVTRTKVSCKDNGKPHDVIDAVLATGVVNPLMIIEHVDAIDDMRNAQPDVFEDLAIAYARANNLRNADLGNNVDEVLFSEHEAKLFAAISDTRVQLDAHLGADAFDEALHDLAALRAPIDEFFENVMIMDEDAAIRENRLRLLNAFIDIFAPIADFGLMAKVKK